MHMYKTINYYQHVLTIHVHFLPRLLPPVLDQAPSVLRLVTAHRHLDASSKAGIIGISRRKKGGCIYICIYIYV